MTAIPTVENISNISETTNSLINNYVVSPILNLGIAGLRFDILEEEKIDDKAEITNHFVEDNSAIQDHITKLPTVITLRGFVGELVDEEADPKSTFQELTEKLVTINSLLPVVTDGAQQLNNFLTDSKSQTTGENIKEGLGTSADLFNAFQQLNPPDSKQARAYNFFKALYNANQLVSVDTPYNFFSDMAIENIVAIQGDNKFISDFAITLKKFRTVETQFVTFDSSKYQGRGSEQRTEQKDQGKIKGNPRNISFLKSLSTGLGSFLPQ